MTEKNLKTAEVKKCGAEAEKRTLTLAVRRFCGFFLLLVMIYGCASDNVTVLGTSARHSASSGHGNGTAETDVRTVSEADFGEETYALTGSGASDGLTVAINLSSGVFHIDSGCGAAKRIAESNIMTVENADIETLIFEGYIPCGVCAEKYK